MKAQLLKTLKPPSWRAGWCRGGFTLIELLTVIAIIAVLATLLMTSLASAKKKSRLAFCTSNLHQITLALNMYLDDFEKRPPGFQELVATKNLTYPQVFLCPEDKTGNWGALVQSDGSLSVAGSFDTTDPEPKNASVKPEFRFSYLNPLPWSEPDWEALLKAGSSAGLLACQLHGLGKANLEHPSVRDFEGLVLRGQRDGAVVRRQIFWDRPVGESADNVAVRAPTFGMSPAAEPAPWQFFTDEPPAKEPAPP